MKRFWPRISIPVVIIAAVWALFSFPSWGKGMIPFPSTYLVTFFPPWSATYGMPVKNNAMPDVITQIYPWKRVTIADWKQGEVPLWNPYSFSGTAHAGNYQSAVFSPVNLLFFLFAEKTAWSVMILLQPLLAGLFMYLFLRSLNRSSPAGAAGGIAFMFCGFITTWMAYGTLAYAALFLPLILYGVNRYMSGSRPGLMIIPFGVALSLVSGHFQISLYVIGFAFVYMLYMTVSAKDRAYTWPLYGALVTGVVLAGPQIGPAVSSYLQAARSGLFTKGEIIPWSYLITLFAPDYYGNPVTRNDWFGHYAEWAGFTGATSLFFVFTAIIRPKRNPRVYFFAGAALILLLFALPTALNDFLYAARIPVLSTSSASRIIVLVSFSLAVLTAYGVDAFTGIWNASVRKKHIRQVSVFVLVFLAGIWATLLILRPLPADKLMIAVRNTVLPSILLVSAAAVAAGGFIIPKRFRPVLLYAFVAITAFDMYRYAAKWMPFDPPSYIYPQEQVISFITERTSESHERIFGNIGNEVGSAFGIQLIEGYDAVYNRRYGEFISYTNGNGITGVSRSVVSVGKQGKYSEEMLQFLGVQYLLHRLSDGRNSWAYPFWEHPQYVRIYQDLQYEVYQNTAVYPRVFMASSYVVRHGTDILDTMFAEGFDRRTTVVLEEQPDHEPGGGSGEVRLVRYLPGRVDFRTDSAADKLLFLSDVYDEGWRAYIDGKRVPLHRADYAFRAVSVPAGSHAVVMRYMPDSFLYGIAAMVFGTLIYGGYGFYLVRRRI